MLSESQPLAALKFGASKAPSMKWVPRQMESAKKKHDAEDVDDEDDIDDMNGTPVPRYAQR